MIEEKKDGLKVAYRDAPTEEEIKAIIRKKKITQTVLAIIFTAIAAAAGWCAYSNRAAIQAAAQPTPEESTSTE
jgi:hypothetical protein